MSQTPGWSQIEAEARHVFAGNGRFVLPAYSEFMPAPFVGFKPYDPFCAHSPATATMTDHGSLDISEYEQVEELRPGLERIAGHVVHELAKLVRGEAHALSRTLLEGNPAWPAVLAEAAHERRLLDDPLALAMPLALSRTQDDKGNNRWTLFGVSHEGSSAAFWRSFEGSAASHFSRVVAALLGVAEISLDTVRILAEPGDLPDALRPLLLANQPVGGVRTLVTFQPFATLPAAVQQAYLARTLILLPTPASLLFHHHPRYAQLAHELPRATQIPLLHLFPHFEGGCAIRIPQSGWLDEVDPAQYQGHGHGHRVVSKVTRTHRWQRIARDESLPGDGAFTDKVTIALFSTNPDDLGLYGKPMARNAQVWTHDYRLLLDGPRAKAADLARASQVTDEGGRFGYRFLFPPMRAGGRELFWHFPLLARRDAATGQGTLLAETRRDSAPHPVLDPLLAGYVSAEPIEPSADVFRLDLTPRLLDRPGHREAATQFAHDPGHRRYTTSHNAHKILEFHEYLDRPLSPELARSLLRLGKEVTLDGWLARLADVAADAKDGAALVARLRECVGAHVDPGDSLTFAGTGTRAFEESVWRTIAFLAEGQFRQKQNADGIAINTGKSGGPAALAAHIAVTSKRDLDQLGDHLHARYRELIAAHHMDGKAEVLDHAFKWETVFDYQWSDGWLKNQSGEATERNVVCVIPGRNRREAVVMGDHYDTAYMEDVYEAARGGDTLRAAARGADDNHSATSALLHAADVLLPLSRDGKLERDVWLVHLTGEEFPADCLGARALVRALVEGTLVLTTERGEARPVSDVRVIAACILDMIAHNSDRDRDVFQIAPGEGAASARLAWRAHLANQRWNRAAAEWNHRPERAGLHRAVRVDDGGVIPPPFAHRALAGEIRTEWEPKSALYNTDGQIFSDAGVPVILFMENYDINRTGYHDTHDTMKNIDLDYAAAMTAIAIETVTDVACAAAV